MNTAAFKAIGTSAGNTPTSVSYICVCRPDELRTAALQFQLNIQTSDLVQNMRFYGSNHQLQIAEVDQQ